MSTIGDLQEAIERSVGRVGPAVVGFGRGWGRGSGVVVGPGRVLTTAHNLRSEEVTVSFPGGPAAAATPTPRTLRWRVANLPKRVLRRTRAILGSRT